MQFKIFLAVISILIAFSSSVFADSDTANGIPPATGGISGFGNGGRHGSKKSHNQQNTGHKSSPGNIAGHCTLLESPNNPISGACVSILLILADSGGNELGRTRTSANGDFEFIMEKDHSGIPPYKISTSSRFYEVISPNANIQGGRQIDLKLKQK